MATSTDRVRALRARRAAELEPGPGAHPRDAGELLGPAVEVSLAALKLGERFAAAAQLARLYAAAVDDASSPAAALRVFGPLLAKVLAELGATPAARKAAPGEPERTRPNKVAALRAAHQASKTGRGRVS